PHSPIRRDAHSIASWLAEDAGYNLSNFSILLAGATLRVKSRDAGWVQFVDPVANETGWISMAYLEPTDAIENTPQPPKSAALKTPQPTPKKMAKLKTPTASAYTSDLRSASGRSGICTAETTRAVWP